MDLPKQFKLYLLSIGLQKITIKNYLSDLSHFFAWLKLKLQDQKIIFSTQSSYLVKLWFTEKNISDYKNSLLSNAIPFSTVNRRLSTLRSFGKFCISQGWITENPTEKIINICLGQEAQKTKRQEEKILECFKKYLEQEKTNSNTIKCYLSDIRGFLNWFEFLET